MRELFVANWKMNLGGRNSLEQVRELCSYCQQNEVAAEVVLCPPATALFMVGEMLSNTDIVLGGQNMHYEDKGAFTGEIAPPFLKETGCRYVIIGHSERRQYFKEGNDLINKKIKAAFRWQLTPILCLGENLTQREAGKAWETVENQLAEGLEGIDSMGLAGLVVAYEPIWAIGTGKWAQPADAQEMAGRIRAKLGEVDNLRILYGGSVKAANISEYMQCEDIDGALVGGASLKAVDFIPIFDRQNS